MEAWRAGLAEQPTYAMVGEVIEAFRGAVAMVGGEKEEGVRWRVEGGAMFNSVVRLAVVGLLPALRRLLK